MSTRANIVLDSKNYNRIWLYHHWDGYPAYLGKKLMSVLAKDGNVVNEWYRDSIGLANKFLKDPKDDGFEITNAQHGDIEYLYKIDTSDRTIRVYKVHGIDDMQMLKCARYDNKDEIADWNDWCDKN